MSREEPMTMLPDFDPASCTLCPRKCGADRRTGKGVCGGDLSIRIARAAPHFWEEPCISGTRGSGTIFFSGCSLSCLFCQNRTISHGNFGKVVTPRRLEEICLELAEKGVHNLNLVTADHQLPMILPVLMGVKEKVNLPIVWNCGGYESPGMIAALRGIVDVWLPDLKFWDPDLSRRYTGCNDYFPTALGAIRQMADQVGKPRFSDGMLTSGVMVRHLVLPGCRKDSLKLLSCLFESFAPDEILLSLMSQYTPNGVPGTPDRRLTTFEYQSVAEYAETLGFEGYFQEKSSAKEEYTPPFDLEGI